MWEDLGYLSVLPCEYHSLHNGGSPHRTRGDTDGGQGGDEWCGGQSPIQSSAQTQLLQVSACFSHLASAGHRSHGSSRGVFFHLCATLQPGKKHFTAPPLCSISHWCVWCVCVLMIILSACRIHPHLMTQQKSKSISYQVSVISFLIISTFWIVTRPHTEIVSLFRLPPQEATAREHLTSSLQINLQNISSMDG